MMSIFIALQRYLISIYIPIILAKRDGIEEHDYRNKIFQYTPLNKGKYQEISSMGLGWYFLIWSLGIAFPDTLPGNSIL